jgi:hypothetical protein
MTEPTNVFRMGFNLWDGTAYTRHDQRADLVRTMIYTYGADKRNENGWAVIDPGMSVRAMLLYDLSEHIDKLDGDYVLTWTPGVEIKLAGSLLGKTKSSTATRVEFTVDTGPARADLGAGWKHGSLAEARLEVLITNHGTRQVTPTLKCFRASEEANVKQGFELSSALIAACTTASRGPNRVMWAMGGWDGWMRTVADIPRHAGPAGNVVESEMQPVRKDDWRVVSVRKSTAPAQGTGFSPEDVSELMARTRQSVWVTMPYMADDACIDAWNKRFLARFGGKPEAMPEGASVYWEPGNEPWNYAAGKANHYLDTGYGADFGTGLFVKLPERGDADRTNRFRNLGHCSLRQWARARAAFGDRARFVVNYQVDYAESMKACVDHVDEQGLMRKGAKVGDIADVHSCAPYLNVGLVNIDPNWADGMKQAMMFDCIRHKAWLDGPYTKGDARKFWRDRYLVSVRQRGANVEQLNRWIGERFKGRQVRAFYEGMMTHDNYNHAANFGANAAHLAMRFDGGVWTAADVTIDGRREAHASVGAAAFWDDGDRAHVGHTPHEPIRHKGYLVKRAKDGIRLYEDRAALSADKSLAVPAGTVAFVVNESRLTALQTFHWNVLVGDTTIFETFRDVMAKQGVQAVSAYALNQFESAYRNSSPWGSQDMRMFAFVKQLGDSTPAFEWVRSRAP